MTWGRAAVAAIVAAALILTAACDDDGGTDDDALFPTVVSLGEGDAFPSIRNSSLAVGPNRFVLSLTDADDLPVLGADVSLRFYDLGGAEPVLRAEGTADFIPVELAFVDEQAEETVITGEDGIYAANVTFDRAGPWGIDVDVTLDDEELEVVPFRFDVLDHTPEPAIGEPAPPSMQATIPFVPAVEDIDSSSPPRPHMHDTTIADAIASGRPAVIAFATPAFCRTRTCAPVMDTVMDPLFEEYGEQAAFVHVEPYALPELREANVQNPVPAVREWRLESEPWVFVVNADGNIIAKFEGVVSRAEVETALQAALNAPS
jgi:hypothetical protein